MPLMGRNLANTEEIIEHMESQDACLGWESCQGCCDIRRHVLKIRVRGYVFEIIC